MKEEVDSEKIKMGAFVDLKHQIEAKISSTPEKNEYLATIEKLESVLPGMLVLEVPDYKDEIQVETNIDTVVDTVVKLGLAKGLHVFPRLFHDEPYLHTAEAGPRGFGHDFFNKEMSLRKALSEAIERSLWEHSDAFYKGKEIVSSYANLQKEKIDIFSLAGFSDEQRQKHPHLQFTHDTLFSWVPTVSLLSQKEIYCPTSLVSLKHMNTKPEPILRMSVSTGQACNLSLTEVQLKATCEIIERDAFMINYLNTITPLRVDLDMWEKRSRRIAQILQKFRKHNLTVHVLKLCTDFPIPVIIAFIEDETGKGPALSMGATCSFDIAYCIEHALSEALSIRFFLKDKYKDPINTQHFELIERMLYWGKQEHVHQLDFMLRESTEVVDVEEHQLTNASVQEKLEVVLNTFREKKYEVCFMETSPKEINNLGLYSGIVVAPQMQPLYLDESIPYHGGTRLHEVPKSLGLKTSKEFNAIPHPFA